VVARLIQSLLGGGARRPPQDLRRLDAALGLLGRRVLVVDDNPANLTLARAVLESAGVDVVAAGDGVLALEALSSGGFDVVLMDVRMPRMGGPDALARIRAGEAGRHDTPVIALSAEGQESRARLLEQGFDGVLGKPVRAADLIGAVTAACASGARRAARAA
jgi:two-component system, sensor histidine kinase